MLLATAQMKAHHKLEKVKDHEVKCMEEQLQLVNTWKLLNSAIDKHLHCNSHINKITSKCYATLSALKKRKRYTLYMKNRL